ncbi:MAG: efflux RND transporter periplasmic adaptor subunit [Gammaproteobacteria bacterium]|nr:efflux RND transporter periplasmic adaptor subunit [Gammaproteobacteria bacterium]
MNHCYRLSILICLLLLFSTSSQAVDLPAVLQYERVVDLSVPVSGTVSSVLVEEGQSVQKGDLLLQLEDLPFKVNVEKTAAELRLLKAERLAMEKELNRNKELYERMVLSTVSLDGSELNFIRADSLWNAKQAELKLVKYAYEKSHLRAPFTGKIIARAVEPGQTIRTEMQAPVLLRLANTAGFIVEAEVTADKIGILAHGVKLQVRIAGKLFPAMVKSTILLSPGQSLSQPARYRVKVKLERTDPGFRPGMSATLVTNSQIK